MIKKITVATTNKAKIDQIRGALMPLGIEVVGAENLPDIQEIGETALQYAHIKATEYVKQLKTRVLSMDNALYFEGLLEDKQPGLHVRRINKNNYRPTDVELLTYYSSLVLSLGERVNARWEFGICVANQDGICHETTIVSPRIFISTPSKIIVPGYPLESIQIDPGSGKIVSEMTQVQQDTFWQKAIGKQLCEFVATL